MSKFMDLITEIVKEGIAVELDYDKEAHCIFANLNFEAKSHGYLYEQEDNLVIKMRYGNEREVEDIQDVCYAFEKALHGRDYGNVSWFELCVKHGILTKNIETKVTYS
jgi:hypothetical protein